MSQQMQINILTNMKEIFDQAKNDGHLWVINVSDKGNTQRRGDVLIILKDEAGADLVISLPATWLPFDLATHAGMNIFETSTAFRNYIRSGLIAVIDTKTADQLRGLPQFRQESERVGMVAQNMRNAQANFNNAAKQTINLNMNSGGVQVTQADEARMAAAPDAGDGDTPQVRQFLPHLDSMKRGDIADRHDEIVAFLMRCVREEVRTVAAGLNDVNSPVFMYIDIAMNNLGEGKPLTTDMFSHIPSQLAMADSNSNEISFGIANR